MRRVAAAVGAGLLLAGCTPHGSADDVSPTASPSVGRVTGESQAARFAADATERLDPLWSAWGVYGDVEIADGVVVARDHEGDPTVLKGLDLATGEPRWRRASSRGALVAEAERRAWAFDAADGRRMILNLSPVTVEHVDDPEFTGTLVSQAIEVVDPATGDLAAGPARYLVRDSYPCEGAEGLCLNAEPAGGPGDFPLPVLRINPETLTPEFFDPATAHPGVTRVRDLDSGIRVEVAHDGAEALVRRVEQEITWSVPVAELGISPVESSLVGSRVVEGPQGEVWQVSVAPSDGDRAEGAAFTAFAFDLDSGELLMSRTGAAWCHTAVLCSHGFAVADVGVNLWANEVADIALEGVDLASGASRWTRTASALDLSGGGHASEGVVWSPESWLVTEAGRTGSIDPDTGEFRPLTAGVVACRVTLRTVDREYTWLSGDDVQVRSGAQVHPCGPDGAAADWWSRAAVEAAATVGEAGGRRVGVVPTAGGLLAFDLGSATGSAE